MQIRSIPTLYNNRTFRSRLEAQWAAWFDSAGWQWTYEPADLYGWCPDFSLMGYYSAILVEVKPVGWKCADELFPRLPLDDYKKAVAPDHDVLLLGLGPCVFHGHAFIGMCNEPNPYDSTFMPAVCQRATEDSGAAFGYCSSDQSYYDRISGYYPGGSWDGVGHEQAIPLWNKAGDKTRWAGRQK